MTAPAPLNKAEWMKLATAVPITTKAAKDAWTTMRHMAEASRSWKTGGDISCGLAALAAAVQLSPDTVKKQVQAGVAIGCIIRTSRGHAGHNAEFQLAWLPGVSPEDMATRMVEALATAGGRKPSSRPRQKATPTEKATRQRVACEPTPGPASGSPQPTREAVPADPLAGRPYIQTTQEKQQQHPEALPLAAAPAAAAALSGSPQNEDPRLAELARRLDAEHAARVDLEDRLAQADAERRALAARVETLEQLARAAAQRRAATDARTTVAQAPGGPEAAQRAGSVTPSRSDPGSSAPAAAQEVAPVAPVVRNVRTTDERALEVASDLDRLLAAAEPYLAAPGGDEHRDAVRDVAEVLTAGVDVQAVPLGERLGVLGHVLRKLQGADPAKRPREPHRLAWTLLLGPAEKRLDSSARESGRRWLVAGAPKPEPSPGDRVRAEMEARRREAEERSRAVQAERAEAARADREAAASGAPKPFDGDELAAARARIAAAGTINPRRPALGASQRVELQRAGKPLTADVGQAPAPPDVEGVLRLLPARAQA